MNFFGCHAMPPSAWRPVYGQQPTAHVRNVKDADQRLTLDNDHVVDASREHQFRDSRDWSIRGDGYR